MSDRLKLLLTVLAWFVSSGDCHTVVQWPAVSRYEKEFRIQSPHTAVVKTFFLGTDGRPLYLFICRTGDDETVLNVSYAGDLDCRLIEADQGEVETNLLVEAHDLAAWYSRARMFGYELLGDCAAYPEYGRIRHFRLRGMRITMTFENVRFSKISNDDGSPSLASYTLRLKVQPDATANRDIAESSGYLDPNRIPRSGDFRSCSVVRKGKEWREN